MQTNVKMRSAGGQTAGRPLSQAESHARPRTRDQAITPATREEARVAATTTSAAADGAATPPAHQVAIGTKPGHLGMRERCQSQSRVAIGAKPGHLGRKISHFFMYTLYSVVRPCIYIYGL
jgi:hypothetical protein